MARFPVGEMKGKGVGKSQEKEFKETVFSVCIPWLNHEIATFVGQSWLNIGNFIWLHIYMYNKDQSSLILQNLKTFWRLNGTPKI